MSVSPAGPASITPNIASGVAAIQSCKAKGAQFASMLADLVQDANGTQVKADQVFEQFVTGETENVHDVVLSVAKADVSFRLLLEIRNHLMEAYQEIMRMQV